MSFDEVEMAYDLICNETPGLQGTRSVAPSCNQAEEFSEAMSATNYGMAPCGRVRVQPASPQLLSAVDNPSSTISGRWIISSSALYLLEQVYKIEN